VDKSKEIVNVEHSKEENLMKKIFKLKIFLSMLW
jgi:hypothetical protein